jgi:hypothetical protein
MISDRRDNDIRPVRLGWKTMRVAQGFAGFSRPEMA